MYDELQKVRLFGDFMQQPISFSDKLTSYLAVPVILPNVVELQKQINRIQYLAQKENLRLRKLEDRFEELLSSMRLN